MKNILLLLLYQLMVNDCWLVTRTLQSVSTLVNNQDIISNNIIRFSNCILPAALIQDNNPMQWLIFNSSGDFF